MSIFRKTVKYSKPSKSLDEKIKSLDKQLVQTGVILNVDDSDSSYFEDEKDDMVYVPIINEIKKVENESYYNWREELLEDDQVDENIVEQLQEELKENKKQIIKVERYITESNKELIEIRDQVFTEISKTTLLNLPEIKEKISRVLEIYDEIQEGLLNEPPEIKNEDPLTPLTQNFVTVEDLNKHYTLFINRIQEQVATIGGGGETQLKYLDDIVGIATNPSVYDGKFLSYNHSIGKFEFVTGSGGGGNQSLDEVLQVGNISSLGMSVGVVTSTQFYGDLIGNSSTSNYASEAGIATYAHIAGIATYALTAGIATYSSKSGIATYANTAGIATYASIAGIATYASTAGIATYASIAGVATYASTAGIATYATTSGIATNATYASTAGIATYASTAGIATYASIAGIATYASIAGVATYASIAGIATVAQGLTGSPDITVGIVTATSYNGSGSNLTGIVTFIEAGSGILIDQNTGKVTITNIGGSGSGVAGITIRDEGVTVGTAGSVVSLNFTGNVIATAAGFAATITIPLQTYVQNAGIATYASTAGIATYASTAGIATIAQGLTGIPNIVVGIVTATSYNGSGSNLTGIVTFIEAGAGISVDQNTGKVTITNTGGGGGSVGLTIRDEGNLVGTAGSITTLNFTGNVVATAAGSASTITIPLQTYVESAGIATYASTAGIATIAGYASTAGIATVAQGLTGTPNITVGIVTATSYNGSGSNLTGIVTYISAGTGISVDQNIGNVTITNTGPSLSGNNVFSGINTFTGNNSFSGNIIIEQASEAFNKYNTAIGIGSTVTLDCSSGNIHYITSTVSANWTANLTNVGVSSGYCANYTLVIIQGTTAYIPNTLQIAGVTTSINWQGGSIPSGNNNKKDVIAYTVFNDAGSYTVFGQLVTFG